MTGQRDNSDAQCTRGKEYQLQLGDSFKNQRELFHYLHYDFKPAKVNEQLPGTLIYTASREIQLAFPSNSGEEEEVVFGGPCQSSKRECFLLFDPHTETFTLEKVTSYGRLKAIRNPSCSLLPKAAPVPISPGPSVIDPVPSVTDPVPTAEELGTQLSDDSSDSEDSDGSSSSDHLNSGSSSSSSMSDDPDSTEVKRQHADFEPITDFPEVEMTEVESLTAIPETQNDDAGGENAQTDDLGLSDSDNDADMEDVH